MQIDMIEHWNYVTASDGEPPSIEDDDFGFDSGTPEFIRQTGQIFIMSNFTIMPEPGGWLDQDEAWCRDILIYLRGYRRAEWENRNMPKSNVVDSDMFKDFGTVVGGNASE